MKIIKYTNKTISETLRVLKKGGLVIFPSDTVYGLLVDATNEKAVKKLIDFKSRPAGRPISVFINNKILRDITEVDKRQKSTINSLFPGPFTIILKSRHKVSNLLESEKGTLGVRIPSYEPVVELVKNFGKPITATSANISGKAPHHSIESLLTQISNKKKKLIDLIVNVGKLPRNKPSTVVDLTEPNIKIVRKGEVVFKDQQTLISQSPVQTKKIAKYILKKLQVTSYKLRKPLVFILQGELGAGKTIFVKGIAEEFGIKDIISPTFVIYYEYDIKNSKLVHVDLYNLQEDEEFEHLSLERYLKQGNVLCFEWGEKTGKIFETLKEKGVVIYIQIKYKDKNEREIQVQY